MRGGWRILHSAFISLISGLHLPASPAVDTSYVMMGNKPVKHQCNSCSCKKGCRLHLVWLSMQPEILKMPWRVAEKMGPKKDFSSPSFSFDQGQGGSVRNSGALALFQMSVQLLSWEERAQPKSASLKQVVLTRLCFYRLLTVDISIPSHLLYLSSLRRRFDRRFSVNWLMNRGLLHPQPNEGIMWWICQGGFTVFLSPLALAISIH